MNNVYNFLLREIKIKTGDIIIVGSSGGPDSMCLMNVLIDIRKDINIKIICAHVNHNVRKESYKEAEFIKAYCIDNDILFEDMVIEKYGDDNFHSEARRIRYSFFEELVKNYEANYLMTAHHGDDLIETVLMRIARGSTIKGYSGFSKILDKEFYTLVRPLIYLTKDEIVEYNKANGVPYATDKSNKSGKYTRNRYRKEILPFLKKEDINIHKKFLKFSENLDEYEKFINKEIKKVINKVYKNNMINIEEYLQLEPVLQNKILYYIMENIYQDDLFSINDAHVNLLKKLINTKRANSCINLPHGKSAIKSYNNIRIEEIKDINSYEIELNEEVKLPNGRKIKFVEDEDSNNNDVCRLLQSEIAYPLYVRTRRLGDKMLLKKIDGYKKVKDVFIDSKIPLRDRESWPIVVDSSGRIIWIPGIKKSKFTKQKSDIYDIILRYE
jgi:tRNA(Ile)-lysidine synthetase, N-terminal domain/tRNA(Ile)-lysidine synthetase, C-terminal domain